MDSNEIDTRLRDIINDCESILTRPRDERLVARRRQFARVSHNAEVLYQTIVAQVDLEEDAVAALKAQQDAEGRPAE